jgi:hypothetical protein
VASVTFDFIDAAFVIVWGGVVSLSFHAVFYRIGASECCSYVCVFEEVGYFAYLWAVVCDENYCTGDDNITINRLINIVFQTGGIRNLERY